jgi:hypothetical protein
VRDGVASLNTPNRQCPVCGSGFHTTSRGIYCSHACRQQAYRTRRLPSIQSAQLPRRPRPVGQTIYECPACENRYLATRRCPDCNLMCRRLGLGGHCLHCDELLLVAELLDIHSATALTTSGPPAS